MRIIIFFIFLVCSSFLKADTITYWSISSNDSIILNSNITKKESGKIYLNHKLLQSVISVNYQQCAKSIDIKKTITIEKPFYSLKMDFDSSYINFKLIDLMEFDIDKGDVLDIYYSDNMVSKHLIGKFIVTESYSPSKKKSYKL